jgi:hypothetical protein
MMMDSGGGEDNKTNGDDEPDDFGLSSIGGLAGLQSLGLTSSSAPPPVEMPNQEEGGSEEAAGAAPPTAQADDGGPDDSGNGGEGCKLSIGDKVSVLVKTIELSKQAMAQGM